MFQRGVRIWPESAGYLDRRGDVALRGRHSRVFMARFCSRIKQEVE